MEGGEGREGKEGRERKDCTDEASHEESKGDERGWRVRRGGKTGLG